MCNRMDYSLPGSSVHGILQARIPEWVAMPSSRGSSQPRDRMYSSCDSCIGFFFTAEPPVKLSMEGWILAIPLRLLVPLTSEQEIMFIVMS